MFLFCPFWDDFDASFWWLFAANAEVLVGLGLSTCAASPVAQTAKKRLGKVKRGEAELSFAVDLLFLGNYHKMGILFSCEPCVSPSSTSYLFQNIYHEHHIFPHITVGFLFSRLHPAGRRPPSSAVVRRRPPPRSLTPLISHNSSHTIHLTHNSSHTIHLTQLISHNSSHTQLISHNSSHTQFISHNSSHTPLISHNSSHTQLISHTTHLTHNSSHTQLISTHLTQLISHHLSHTTHLTQLISHTTHLTHNSSHTTSTHSFLTELRRGLSPQWPRLFFVWQAQYTELPEGAAARIVAGVAAASLCVAGAVHRAS